MVDCMCIRVYFHVASPKFSCVSDVGQLTLVLMKGNCASKTCKHFSSRHCIELNLLFFSSEKEITCVLYRSLGWETFMNNQ